MKDRFWELFFTYLTWATLCGYCLIVVVGGGYLIYKTEMLRAIKVASAGCKCEEGRK